MTNRLISLLALVIIFAIFGAVILIWKLSPSGTITTITSQPSLPFSPTPSVSLAQKSVVIPVADFRKRITKKSFGTYITPTNSPISPERFTGYHTGVDVEYSDVTADVPVFAIADGTVVTSEPNSGYGGVMVIQHQTNGRPLYAIYGHLRPKSMAEIGAFVTQRQQIAVLGTAHSPETDQERRHLHFGIAASNTITGYVSSTAQLHTVWTDPLSLYQ